LWWDQLRSGQFLFLRLGRVSHLWFGSGFEKFSLKFSIFSTSNKKNLKSTRVKEGSASYLLWLKSILGLGQAPSLPQSLLSLTQVQILSAFAWKVPKISGFLLSLGTFQLKMGKFWNKFGEVEDGKSGCRVWFHIPYLMSQQFHLQMIVLFCKIKLIYTSLRLIFPGKNKKKRRFSLKCKICRASKSKTVLVFLRWVNIGWIRLGLKVSKTQLALTSWPKLILQRPNFCVNVQNLKIFRKVNYYTQSFI